MVTATLPYRSGDTKFYIAEPKTPLETNYSTRAAQSKIYFFPDSTTRGTKTVGTSKVTTTILRGDNE